MLELKLFPQTNSGYTATKDGTYDAGKDGKVSAVMFLNQSTRCDVQIIFPGVNMTLIPGAMQEISSPAFGHDITEYQYNFFPTGGGAAIKKLIIITQKFVGPNEDVDPDEVVGQNKNVEP